ncbi:MAG: glycoside hydrolase family 6 protein, partial [Pseudomonadota bacterium]
MTRPANLLVTDWTKSYELYAQPHAIWLDADDRVGANEPRLRETLDRALAKKQYPEIVVYAIPLRDLGQSSEGGFANYDDYWKDNELNAALVGAFVKATGLAPRIYLEPDALSLSVQYRVDHNNNAESMRIYAERIAIFRKLIALYRRAGARVYLEAGHSGWFDYADENVDRIATALNEAGIDQADGLAPNVSNREPLSNAGAAALPGGRNERHYLQRLLPRLNNRKLDVVVDTSRNGGKTHARQYFLAPNGMLIDNETAGGIKAAFRLVGNWQKDPTGDILITPFHGKQKSFIRLLAKEKYTFNAEKGILQAPPWLDAVGDVQPGLPPTDQPPAEVAGVIHRLRYIKPPDDCDGALNC